MWGAGAGEGATIAEFGTPAGQPATESPAVRQRTHTDNRLRSSTPNCKQARYITTNWLSAAESLEHFAVRVLPVLYMLLNAALFAHPCYREWRQGATPADVGKERRFIAWADIKKVDPWVAGEGAAIAEFVQQAVPENPAVRQRTHMDNPAAQQHAKF